MTKINQEEPIEEFVLSILKNQKDYGCNKIIGELRGEEAVEFLALL